MVESLSARPRREWGSWSEPSLSARGLGECCKLPSGVRGKASFILDLDTKPSPDSNFCKLKLAAIKSINVRLGCSGQFETCSDACQIFCLKFRGVQTAP